MLLIHQSFDSCISLLLISSLSVVSLSDSVSSFLTFVYRTSFNCFVHLFQLFLASLSFTSRISSIYFSHLFQLFLALLLIPSLTSFSFVLLLFPRLLASLSFVSHTVFSWIPSLSQFSLESIPVSYCISLISFSHLSQVLLPLFSVTSSTYRICYSYRFQLLFVPCSVAYIIHFTWFSHLFQFFLASYLMTSCTSLRCFSYLFSCFWILLGDSQMSLTCLSHIFDFLPAFLLLLLVYL
jgi:hypothetical protein